jgi:hypothetical protein
MLKHLLAALFLCLVSVTSAHACTAPCTKTQVLTDINTNLQDNNKNLITPALVRTSLFEIVNSYLDIGGASSFVCPANQFITSISSLSTYACAPALVGVVAGGGLSGTYPNPTVVTVAAGATGPLSATDPTTTNSRAPTGAAGGGLSGTYPNPSVVIVAAGGAGPLSATDPSVTNARTPTGTAGGSLSGTYPNPTVVAATKAQQQTGTSTTVVVTPSQQQSHDSAAKAWCNFNGATTGTHSCNDASYNVTSVTRTSAGNYQINFTIPFADTNYACTATVEDGATNAFFKIDNGANKTTSSILISALNSFSSTADVAAANIICFGRQ